MKAKYDQETRDLIESIFKSNNYSKERQISFLRIKERQQYNYYCDCSSSWTNDEYQKYQNEWNEILDMLDERIKEAQND